MSKVIGNDHPWSDEEIEYKLARGLTHEVEKNKQQNFVAAQEDSGQVTLELDQDVYDYVMSRSVAQLQSDLRAVDISPKGNESELRAKLAQHLQAEKEESGDSDS